MKFVFDDDARDLDTETVLAEFGPLPQEGAAMGMAEDSLPVLLNLDQPNYIAFQDSEVVLGTLGISAMASLSSFNKNGSGRVNYFNLWTPNSQGINAYLERVGYDGDKLTVFSGSQGIFPFIERLESPSRHEYFLVDRYDLFDSALGKMGIGSGEYIANLGQSIVAVTVPLIVDTLLPSDKTRNIVTPVQTEGNIGVYSLDQKSADVKYTIPLSGLPMSRALPDLST
jgi:hypothetical protein